MKISIILICRARGCRPPSCLSSAQPRLKQAVYDEAGYVIDGQFSQSGSQEGGTSSRFVQ